MSQLPESPPTRSAWECQSLADSMRARLEIYTPAQLAAKLGISRRSVRAAIRSGKLEAKKVNARVHLIESYQAAKWWVSL